MEDFDDLTVQQWVKAQVEYTIETLSQLPGRDNFVDRLKELDDSVFAKVSGVLRLANGKIFYRKIEIQNDTSKLYMLSSTEVQRFCWSVLMDLGLRLVANMPFDEIQLPTIQLEKLPAGFPCPHRFLEWIPTSNIPALGQIFIIG